MRGSVKGQHPDMRKIAIMLTATTAIATSFSLICNPPHAWAEGDSPAAVASTITTTDEHGRKIYTNESEPVRVRAVQAPQAKRSALVYWSSRENSWKPG